MDYLILALATWRLSSLITYESGPFGVFDKFRVAIGVKQGEYGSYGENELAKGIACLWCNSIWVGAILTALLALSDLTIWLALPFALSSGAILVEMMDKR
jgi:hypothetical protein